MIRSRKTDLAFSGEITAFLSLIFVLMLSVVGALVQSASIQMTRSRKRADVSLALESAFAEYNPEMLEKYDLFVRCENSDDWLISRLAYYGASGITHRITKTEFLSDYEGLPYYEQAVRYMKDWIGMEGTLSGGGVDVDTDSSWEDDEQILSAQLDGLLAGEESELSDADNPFCWLENMKGMSLLTLVVPQDQEVSEGSVELQHLPSERTLQKGNYEKSARGGSSDKMLFTAYLTEHFSDFTQYEKAKALSYEQEYLLGGKATDRENLEIVCKKIVTTRMVVNYLYLLTDTTRQAEAGTLATGICSLFASPYISEVIKQAILLAWAYGESIVDVRVLLKQKRVPAIKTGDTWQLQLSNVVKLGTAGEVTDEKEVTMGLSYQDYLTGLLFAEDMENLCMRSLDIIESDLHIKVDQCMTAVEVRSEVELRRNIRDTFLTSFGYQ